MLSFRSQPAFVAAISLTALVGVGAFGTFQPPAGPPPAAQGDAAADPLGPDVITAITNNDTAKLKALLVKGAKTESANWLGLHPLTWAAMKGNEDACALLIEYKADVNADTMFGAPLEAAVMGGDPKIVKMLLDHGAKPTKSRLDKMTGLMIAAESGKIEIVKLLLGTVDINAQSVTGMTALAHASRRGQTELVRLLLTKGANPDLADLSGRTPLMYAAMNGQIDAVRYLLASGADAKAQDKVGDNALSLAARYSGQPEVARQLLAKGANPAEKDARGYTAAAIARQRGYAEFAKLLPAMTGGPKVDTAFPKQVQDAIHLSLPLIEKATNTFSAKIGCGSCHHQGVGLQVTGVAKANGFKIDEKLAQSQQKLVLAEPENAIEGIKQINPHPEMYNRIPGVDMGEFNPNIGSTFNSLVDQNVPRSEVIEQTILLYARQQSPDGSWGFALHREPVQSSVFTYTAYAIRLMKQYMPEAQAKERDERIARAIKWMVATFPVTNEDRTFRLLGMKWAGAPDTEVQKAIGDLRRKQRTDGGWAQFSGPNFAGPSFQLSDAYATGEALYALHIAGVPAKDATYRRGVQYLLRTQDADGSWYVNKRANPVNNFLDFGFPHGESQYISYSATCWATMALIYADEKK